MDHSAPGAFAKQRCSCCPTNWKHVDLGPAQKAAGDGSHAPTGGLRDRLAVISRQLALSSVPRPLSSASPAPAAAGDGGILINTVCGEISTTQLGWTVSPTQPHCFCAPTSPLPPPAPAQGPSWRTIPPCCPARLGPICRSLSHHS